MAINYVGDTEWEEQPGARYSQDDFGLDVIEVPYKGITSKLDAFLAQWPAGRQHPDYSKMFKVGQSVSRTPTFSEVVVRFRGTITGNLPKPIVRREYPLNTAQLTTNQPDVDDPVTVFYQSTAYSIQWVAETEPSTPQYRSLLTASATIFFHDYDPPKRNLEGTVQYDTDILTTEFTTENIGNRDDSHCLYTVRERHELIVIAEDESISNRV